MGKDIIDYAIQKLEEGFGGEEYVCDLHQKIFNEDYFISNCQLAEAWLIKYPGVFNAIRIIQEYERENRCKGETDLSSLKDIVNMYVYIQGEYLWNALIPFDDETWEGILTDDISKTLIEKLKELKK